MFAVIALITTAKDVQESLKAMSGTQEAQLAMSLIAVLTMIRAINQ